MNLEALEEQLRGMREELSQLAERLRPRPTCFKYEEAAAELGIGLTHLKAMVRRGEIRVSDVGGAPRISRSEIDRVAAPREEQPRVEREQRRAAWVPIKKRSRAKPSP